MASATRKASLWVIGAALALFGMVWLSFLTRPQRVRPEHAVLGPKLTLRQFQPVANSDVLRATLGDDSGYSSSYRTRNVLFVEPSGEGRWLLPDDDHLIQEYPVAPSARSHYEQSAPVAVVALAKPISSEERLGTLYVYDPTGRRVERVAEDVRELHGAALTTAGAAILYERGTGYVLAHYDVQTLARIREVPVAVSALK